MGFLDKYPYTDFHELNLDWFLERFRELAGVVEDIQHTLEAITPLIESLPEYEQLTDQIKIVLYGDPDDPAYPNTGLIWKVNTYAAAFDQLQYDFNELANDFDLFSDDTTTKLNQLKGTSLYQTLASGNTSVTFTDDVIDVTDHNKFFSIFTTVAGLHPVSVIHSGNTVTINFPAALPDDVGVYLNVKTIAV